MSCRHDWCEGHNNDYPNEPKLLCLECSRIVDWDEVHFEPEDDRQLQEPVYSHDLDWG